MVKDIRDLAEDNLRLILERALQNDGRVVREDAQTGQFLTRVIEVETSAGAYGGSTYFSASDLAAAAGNGQMAEAHRRARS